MITIYGNFLSRATRCLWMLEELGLPYENPQIAPQEASKVAAHNPNAKVPCLVDGDYKLFESMAINLYLAHRYGKAPFWPSSPQDVGLVYQWSLWAMTEIEPPLVAMLVELVFKPAGTADQAVITRSIELLTRPMKVLDDALAGRKWLLGDSFTAADLNLASVVHLVDMVKLDTNAWPHVRAWLTACTGRPVWRKAHGL